MPLADKHQMDDPDHYKHLTPESSPNSGADGVALTAREYPNPVERLLGEAKSDGVDIAALGEILWLLNVNPDLPGFPQACSHVRQILSLISDTFATEFQEFSLHLWRPALTWIETCKDDLATRIFWEKTPNFLKNRESFLRKKAPNPLLNNGKGITQYGMHGALWCSHPTDELRTPYRLLQAHLLLAHISVMHYAVPIEHWNYGKGSEPFPEFYERLARPGWAVRRFTDENGQWKGLLSKVEFKSTRSQLPDKLRALANEIAGDRKRKAAASEATDNESETSPHYPTQTIEERALRTISSFLDWGMDPANLKTRTRLASGGSGGGGVVFGGAGDDEEGITEDEAGNDNEAELPVEDGGHDGGDGSSLHIQLRWRRHTKQYKAAIRAGDHPGEANSSQDISLADDMAGVHFAAGGGIEMANQLLPWAYNDISITELAPILSELQQAADQQQQQEDLELLALMHVMLWVGASLEQAVSLEVFTGDISNPTSEVALRLDALSNEAGSTVSEWWVRALTLKYQPETLPPPDKSRKVVEFIRLLDHVSGAFAVENLVKYRRDVANDPLAQPGVIAKQPLRVFNRNIGWYNTAVRQLVE